MNKRFFPLFLALSLIVLSGCVANQPVVWDDPSATHTGMNISSIEVEAPASTPASEIAFIKQDIQNKLASSNFWNEQLPGCTLKVVITKYNKGNAFARFMLIGLGQMHLHGTVELISGNPPKVIQSGTFEKKYVVGGLVGLTATMRNDVTSKLGQAIVESLNN
ncbi:MAG: hypothetical protein COB04_01470 [Gammaproteobacteria bacterium]|nr:MAG: hypothetical protein COB04_01470 [Gammaproteobacteria bacterium]